MEKELNWDLKDKKDFSLTFFKKHFFNYTIDFIKRMIHFILH